MCRAGLRQAKVIVHYLFEPMQRFEADRLGSIEALTELTHEVHAE
jgi:hypothetical protein